MGFEQAYLVMPAKNTLVMWISYFDDTWAPVGGMQAFAKTLVRLIREHGGRVYLGIPVQHIRVEYGQVTGIWLANGTRLDADWVISAADLRHTCLELIGRDHLTLACLPNLKQRAPPSRSLPSSWACAAVPKGHIF